MEDDEWEYLEKTTEWVRAPSLEELCTAQDRRRKKMTTQSNRLGKEFVDLTHAVQGATGRLHDLRGEILDCIPEETKTMLNDKDTPSGEYSVTGGEYLYTFDKKDSRRIILKVKRLTPF